MKIPFLTSLFAFPLSVFMIKEYKKSTKYSILSNLPLVYSYTFRVVSFCQNSISKNDVALYCLQL